MAILTLQAFHFCSLNHFTSTLAHHIPIIMSAMQVHIGRGSHWNQTLYTLG